MCSGGEVGGSTRQPGRDPCLPRRTDKEREARRSAMRRASQSHSCGVGRTQHRTHIRQPPLTRRACVQLWHIEQAQQLGRVRSALDGRGDGPQPMTAQRRQHLPWRTERRASFAGSSTETGDNRPRADAKRPPGCLHLHPDGPSAPRSTPQAALVPSRAAETPATPTEARRSSPRCSRLRRLRPEGPLRRGLHRRPLDPQQARRPPSVSPCGR